MVKYLESVGYSCKSDENNQSQSCVRIDGIKKESMLIENGYYTYTFESKNEYNMSISSKQYSYGYTGGFKAVEVNNVYRDDYTCYYVPKNYSGHYSDFLDDNRWEIGDTSTGYTNGHTGIGYGTIDCPYDFSEKVNKMLREFESYFENSGISLIND